MKPLKNFALYHEIDPEGAKDMLPGVNFLVSRRTLAQVAYAKFVERFGEPEGAASMPPCINKRLGPGASTAPSITREQAEMLFDSLRTKASKKQDESSAPEAGDCGQGKVK